MTPSIKQKQTRNNAPSSIVELPTPWRLSEMNFLNVIRAKKAKKAALKAACTVQLQKASAKAVF